MYLLGHLAFGYLLVVALARVRDWEFRYPHGLTLALLVVGMQLPDLIDKPLAYAGVLPNGRSLARSLLIVVPVVVVGVRYLLRRGYGTEARVLAVAIASHSLAIRISSSSEESGANLAFCCARRARPPVPRRRHRPVGPDSQRRLR
ncbi:MULTISPECIES: hypothetical protein [Haloferax]|uniref:hypothetical protein n=1 Tax=Haloferax TaxID=2251 RepID=UPI001F1B489E|nr:MULTISPECIES: hypothetical protein [Haloferax]WEL26791.1 Membrane-bound metal-dependent hydrolase YbcI, DUF457 family [Haloferax lucentense]